VAREVGLKLVPDDRGEWLSHEYRPVSNAREILGLSLDDWLWIVDPNYYAEDVDDVDKDWADITPGMVAARIRAIINKATE
jgi:hypothetical protein